MVNNAGIAVDSMRPANLRIHEVPEAAYDKVVGVNLKGVWLGCSMFCSSVSLFSTGRKGNATSESNSMLTKPPPEYAITQMLAQPPHSSGDRGWIVNTASILGFVGFAGLSEYSASKGGVVNLVCFFCLCILFSLCIRTIILTLISPLDPNPGRRIRC